MEWKIAENRVTPPSTIISNTMSALLRPYCGRAFGSFGMRTLSGRRLIDASPVTGIPVSGQIFGFGVGVGVGGGVGGPVGVVAWVATATALELGEPTATGVAPPPQALATSVQMNRTTVAFRASFDVISPVNRTSARHAEPPGSGV